MKTLKSIFGAVLLVLFVSLSAIAQTETKVIAVVNHADWCSVCKQNGERAQAAFMANNPNETFQFVVNNLTSDETRRESAKELKNHGLDKLMAEYKGSGMVYFFDAKTKKLLSQVSVAKSDEEISKAMSTAADEVWEM